MFSNTIGDRGIQEKTKLDHAAVKDEVIKRVRKYIQSDSYWFTQAVKNEEHLEDVEKVFEKVKWAHTLVVVGIGGSDLGGRAIQNALMEKKRDGMQVIFFGEYTDPSAIEELAANIDISNTVFNIVSKSGSTVETMAHYLYLKQVVKDKHSGDWQRRFVFTTDSEGGLLRQEAAKEKILSLPVPRNAGGRFSVFSPVGLLPAVAMGINPREIMAGARAVIKQFEHDEQEEKKEEIGEVDMSFEWGGGAEIEKSLKPSDPLPVHIAWQQFLLSNQGIKTVVIWPYSSRLEEFGRWFRQLWAESLGKAGKGILPIQARGPADQHSQLQFYTQGVPMSSFLFVSVTDHGKSPTIKSVDIPELKYLEGKNFNTIVNVEQKATAQALANVGRPVASIEMAELNPITFGALLMIFELAVVLIGEFMGINAFDQPGVEESKRIIKNMLEAA